MYSYFTFLELVKVISVHRAHRLLSEATLILCYVEEQAFGDRQWFRPASERQRYQHTGKTTLASSHKRPLSRLPVSPIIIERLRLLSANVLDNRRKCRHNHMLGDSRFYESVSVLSARKRDWLDRQRYRRDYRLRPPQSNRRVVLSFCSYFHRFIFLLTTRSHVFRTSFGATARAEPLPCVPMA